MPLNQKPTKKEKKEANEKIIIQPGFLFKIDPEGKYLIVMPKDADIKLLSQALSSYFYPAKVFLLAANDVSQIKIAALIEQSKVKS